MKRDSFWFSVSVIILALIGSVVALFSYLQSAQIPVLHPAGIVALGERQVILTTLLLCAVVVIPVFLMLFVFIWRYRVDSTTARQTHYPEWDHSNGAAEVVWWLVPALIIGVLSVLAWKSSAALDPYRPLSSSTPPLTIEVVALDWKWLFVYPAQGIASINEVEFPVNTPVHFELTADAPMNTFWIPSLAGQIMVMPGMQTQLNLMADQVGTFRGLSGNISGNGFAGMPFSAKAVSESEFQSWIQSIASTSEPLTTTTYAALAEPSVYVPVTYYAPVAPSLYTAVIMKYMTPTSDTATSSTQ